MMGVAMDGSRRMPIGKRERVAAAGLKRGITRPLTAEISYDIIGTASPLHCLQSVPGVPLTKKIMRTMHYCAIAVLSCTALVASLKPARAETILPAGSVWKYLDTGVDQGTAWREPAFDDTSWAAGPAQLGFGDGDEATVINHFPNGSPIIT